MKRTQTILMSLSLIFVAAMASGQTNEEGKIKVEITREINGVKETFKGEYDSKEEMNADPNYQEFSGGNDEFHWFGDEDDLVLHLDNLKSNGKSFFKFFDESDEEDLNSFFFKHFKNGEDSDEGSNFFFKHFDDDEDGAFIFKHFDGSGSNFFNFEDLEELDLEEHREHLKELGIELDVLLDNLKDGEQRRSVRVLAFKRIKISDVEDEFGKNGKVSANNKLELDDLAFSPNPSSNGRFKVRFDLPQEGELQIKVSNLEGKEVFSRYFERFGGTYSELIDLSGQKDGIYLLEISQGKKRLTKKVMIN